MAQKPAEDAKRRFDAAKLALEAARKHEAQVGKRYDDALRSVESASHQPLPK